MIGSVVIELKETISTNIYLSELINKIELQEGTVISALKQIGGRGHGANKWESESGKNLTFSIILSPFFLPIEKQFLLNEVVSLGVYDFTKQILIKHENDIKIKWPNDIYIGEKKVCGILIENYITEKTFKHAIIGIGVNINQEKFISDAPNPISFKNISNKEYDLKNCLSILCICIEKRYNQLIDYQYQEITNDYHSALYRLNEKSEFYYMNKKIYATIKGITEYGKLILENEYSQIIKCDFNEIKIIK